MKSEVSKNFKKDGKNSPVFKSDDGAVIEIIEVSKNKKIAELKINGKVISASELMGIKFFDHIIIAGKRYSSIRDLKLIDDYN